MVAPIQRHPEPLLINSLAPTIPSSWAFARATALDLSGSRGLLADIVSASVLKKQAAFAVLASVELDDPQPFLSRLGIRDGTIGDAVRTRRARDLIGVAFEVEMVPSGFLRALVRVGEKPLSGPICIDACGRYSVTRMRRRKRMRCATAAI